MIKFTPRGGQARVELVRDEAAQEAILRVSDDGVGMSEAMLGRLFEPFMQADETLDRSRGGLGIGLSLVRALVELHHGRVRAASAGPNLGSTFVVRLPLVQITLDEVAPAPALAPRARRVLVIEDNLDSAESVRDVLEMAGHTVELSHSGPEGIQHARAFGPDLVLCDIGLPGLDGYEVAKALRADPAHAGTFLVALSGYATPEDVARARAAGFDRHLAKPVDTRCLLEVVGQKRLTPADDDPPPE